MLIYQEILRRILEEGTLEETRARLLSTKERVRALSVFGHLFRWDLSEGFPLLTTKRVPFKAVVTELAWFLRGKTNVGYLRERGVTIWDEWADSEGDLGPVYPKQWRDFGGVDQIRQVVRQIEEVVRDPSVSYRRRLLVSAWNPPEIPKMALPPCHWAFQFSVRGGKLSLMWFQRSCDAFLGLPFNIASYALLTHLVAKNVGLEVGELLASIGDLHLYENHWDQVNTQLSREPGKLPELRILPEFRGVLEFEPEQVVLEGYKPQGALPGEVAV